MGRKMGIVALLVLVLCLVAVYLMNSLGGSIRGSARPPGWDENLPASGMNASTSTNATTAVDPREVIFCDVLHDRATRGECDYYNEILANLEYGGGGVDAPKTMVRGETATVSFAVSENPVETPVSEFLGAQPEQQVALKVGRKMAAELQGDGFKIDPPSLQKRDLFIGKGARWSWKVTALKAPRHRLLLSAYVVVFRPNGSEKENLLKTLELPLTVRVTWGQWFDDFLADSTAWLTKGTNWLKALTLFLLAIGGLIAVFRKKKPPPSVPA